MSGYKEKSKFFDAVREKTKKTELDNFDLICHLTYDKAFLTKIECMSHVKKHYFYKYLKLIQKVLSVLLDKYANEDTGEIEETKVIYLKGFTHLKSPMKIVKAFDDKTVYQHVIKELKAEIYST